MQTNINEIKLELFLRNKINQNIELSLSKNIEYKNLHLIKIMFKDKTDDFFNFIREQLFEYTLRLLIIEVVQLTDLTSGDLIDIEESIATQLIDKNTEELDSINKILNEHYAYSYREINLNTSIKNAYKTFNTLTNLVDYHTSSDNDYLQKLDLLSLGYLTNDLKTKFDKNYFINELSFLYKIENQKQYLMSSKDYLSYLSNTLSKDNNLFSHCINLRDTILSKDPKKTKNYARLLKSVESKYNEYIENINLIIQNTNLETEKILLKAQFDNFLYNNFFFSLDNDLFDYLSKNIDLKDIINKNDSQYINESYNIIKEQHTLFNTNFLKLMMFFNVDLNQLIDKTSSLEFIIFNKKNINSVLETTTLGFSFHILLDELFILIFDIFWNYYTSVGEILSTIINNNFKSSLDEETKFDYLEELIKSVYKLLNKFNYHRQPYSKINITNQRDINHRKNYSLLISYLLLSTIHQKSFYNLHFE